MDSLNENQIETKPNYYNTNQSSVFTLVAAVLFILVTLFGCFRLYQSHSLNNQLESAKIALEEQKKVIKVDDNQEVSSKLKKNFLAQKKTKQIFWTNVIARIESSIPNKDKVQLNSFAGSDNGSINLNLNTTTNSIDPFMDTARLIENFKIRKYFENVFIPSISSSVDGTGSGILAYSMRFDYNKEANETLPTALQTPTVAAPTVKTPDPKILEELKKKVNNTNPQ